jgi:DNA-binding NarL/FixJ family response regulator
MDKRAHWFLSSHGDLLPRWREAFPEAIAKTLQAKVSHGGTPLMIWVRLQEGVAPEHSLGELRSITDTAPVVTLSDSPSDQQAIACLAAGARGYCNTHAAPTLLQRISDVVIHGGLWIGESLMQRLLQGTARMPAPTTVVAPPEWAALLTERERQVASAVATGSSNKEIARKLGITERTVKAHTGAIFEKLGVRDRLQLSLVVHGRKAG